MTGRNYEGDPIPEPKHLNTDDVPTEIRPAAGRLTDLTDETQRAEWQDAFNRWKDFAAGRMEPDQGHGWWAQRAKMVVALLVTLPTAVVGTALAAFGVTDPTWTGVVVGVITVLGTVFGVERVENRPKDGE